MILQSSNFWLHVLVLTIGYHQMKFVDAYTSQKTVELAVFIDQYLYHYWFTTLRSKALETPASPALVTHSMHHFIRSYLDALLESLNLIYAHPSLASFSSSPFEEEVPLIGFQLAHTEIFWVKRKARSSYSASETMRNLFEATSAAPNYLETFCDFANNANWDGNRWDHALLLTGVDLKFPNGTNYSVAGISWDNSMCNKTYSCSVVEAKTFRSVMTAVHEIGHSLGMEHDGKRYNSKCPTTGYIMSHAGGDNVNYPIGKIAWSPCSKHNLKAFLATAPNVLRNQVACLNNNKPEMGRSGITALNPVNHLRDGRYPIGRSNNEHFDGQKFLPGGKFSVVEQCELGGGVKWRPSRRRAHVKKLCSMLYCNNTQTGELIPFHPALEGTPCGRNKICKYGECVPV